MKSYLNMPVCFTALPEVITTLYLPVPHISLGAYYMY